MKILLLLTVLLTTGPAFAGIESRADSVKASVQGKTDYHAHMARELVIVAQEEKDQQHLADAAVFMDEAEKHAAQSGGK